MSNSIRTPRQGMSATSRKIAEAVDDEEWQKFRLSMKGQSTQRKLGMLEEYYLDQLEDIDELIEADEAELANKQLDVVKIRIDNYIKALCRGGQLYPGESFETAINHNWNLLIKK